MIRVLVIPIVLVGVATIRFVVHRRRRPEADAARAFRADIYLVVFIVYPGVCNEAFSMVVSHLCILNGDE